MRRSFWLAFWTVVLVVVGRGALLPARLRAARLTSLSGLGPTYAMLSWGYGAGARPTSVIFDLRLAGEAAGSVTVDGEATEAEVPLIGLAAPGGYTISATAVYRALGRTLTRSDSFSGSVG